VVAARYQGTWIDRSNADKPTFKQYNAPSTISGARLSAPPKQIYQSGELESARSRLTQLIQHILPLNIVGSVTTPH